MSKHKHRNAPSEGPGPPEAASETKMGADEAIALLQRERADFLNYRRRVDQERAEDRDRAVAETVQRVLPLLDDLDRALAQRPDDLAGHPWVQGVMLLRSRLRETLSGLGVAIIGAAGEPFDPALHEAVFFDVRPDGGEARVVEVVRPGYRIGGRLIRPAQVGVAGASGAAETGGGNGAAASGNGHAESVGRD